MREAARLIRAGGGDVRIRDIAEKAGVTERSLERAFGTSSASVRSGSARIVRFQRSLRNEDDLAYYDQSHRIHEFRELAGITPTEFWRERHAMNDAFVGNLQS